MKLKIVFGIVDVDAPDPDWKQSQVMVDTATYPDGIETEGTQEHILKVISAASHIVAENIDAVLRTKLEI